MTTPKKSAKKAEPKSKSKWTIITGDPTVGFELYGIFDSNAEAAAYASDDPHLDDGDWWTIEILNCE